VASNSGGDVVMDVDQRRLTVDNLGAHASLGRKVETGDSQALPKPGNRARVAPFVD